MIINALIFTTMNMVWMVPMTMALMDDGEDTQ